MHTQPGDAYSTQPLLGPQRTLQNQSKEPQGLSELPVISWSKVCENHLGTQAGMLGSQGQVFFISVSPVSD